MVSFRDFNSISCENKTSIDVHEPAFKRLLQLKNQNEPRDVWKYFHSFPLLIIRFRFKIHHDQL